MPRFDSQSYVNPLSDEQIALISNYVLNQFGNSKLRVTAADVTTARQGGAPSALLLLTPYVLPAAVAAAAVVGLLLVFWARRRWQPAAQT